MQRPSLTGQWRYLNVNAISQKLRRTKDTFVTGLEVRLNFKKISLVVGAILLLGAVVAIVFPTTRWTVVVPLAVNIKIIDRESKEPVADARVTYKYPASDPRGRGEMDAADFDKIITTATTDQRGQCSFTHGFAGSGTTSIKGKRGVIVFDHNLRVEATGYRVFETPLQLLVGSERSIADRSPVAVTIALYRN